MVQSKVFVYDTLALRLLTFGLDLLKMSPLLKFNQIK